MEVIEKGTTKEWTLTLSELSTLTNPTYLFKLTSQGSLQTKIFLARDTSSYPDRYNTITVTETSGTEILTSGTVNLSPAGQWDYEVYEQTSTTNLDVNLCDNKTPIQYGRVLVIGTNPVTFKKRSNTINYKGYGG